MGSSEDDWASKFDNAEDDDSSTMQHLRDDYEKLKCEADGIEIENRSLQQELERMQDERGKEILELKEQFARMRASMETGAGASVDPSCMWDSAHADGKSKRGELQSRSRYDTGDDRLPQKKRFVREETPVDYRRATGSDPDVFFRRPRSTDSHMREKSPSPLRQPTSSQRGASNVNLDMKELQRENRRLKQRLVTHEPRKETGRRRKSPEKSYDTESGESASDPNTRATETRELRG